MADAPVHGFDTETGDPLSGKDPLGEGVNSPVVSEPKRSIGL